MTDRTQQPLFPPPEGELERRARDFVAQNPHVWDLFVRFALELVRAGRTHYSARAVFHRIRWHVAVETRGDEYKINNNYSPVFARWFHELYPEHGGFFRTRGREAA